MPKINTEIFIARRISSKEGGRKNVMVRIATLTVAVGMAVMIVTMAVIGGFKKEITDKLVGFGAHLRIVNLDSSTSLETSPITIDPELMDAISQVPDFGSIAPYAIKGGIIKTKEAIQGVVLKGVGEEYDMGFYRDCLIRGSLPEVGDSVRRKDLLISKATADMLYLDVNDRVELLFISDSRPVRRDRFKVCGIYSSGMDEMDRTMTLTDIRNVRRLNGWSDDMASGYEVMTTDFNRLDEFNDDVYIAVLNRAEKMCEILKVENIVALNPNTFDWLKTHDVNAVVVIVIMLLVALLNMTSAMLIILLEKTSMIGLLKALGMTNGSVQKIFLFRSLKIVITGMLYGNVAGLSIALLQKYTGLLKLDSTGYMLSQVPIEIGWGWFAALNIGVPVVMAILLAVPAMVVTGIKPDRTMRYQ